MGPLELLEEINKPFISHLAPEAPLPIVIYSLIILPPPINYSDLVWACTALFRVADLQKPDQGSPS